MKKTPTDITILHRCTINDNHMMLVSEISSERTKFFVILDHFLLYYLPNNPKNQNFEKMKKTIGSIIILHKCSIHDNHMMMYGSWDMKCDAQNFLSFGNVFCPFTPITTQKIKILTEKSSFYTSVPNIMIICYTVPWIWHVTDLIVIFHFELFFTLLPP